MCISDVILSLRYSEISQYFHTDGSIVLCCIIRDRNGVFNRPQKPLQVNFRGPHIPTFVKLYVY